ncbi:CD209 antigen-like protein C [Brachyistius frenatus]|uniref:CD209 antigen-like protein C n=1 Tax=Brachyistius frenatus TaxID=100188 RepID=UPI0037E77B4E
MTTDKRSKYGGPSQSPVWWIGVAAVSLGLFLLIVIFGLVIHNASAIGHHTILQVGLATCQKLVHNLTTDKDALRDERDQIKINASRMTNEMQALQSNYITLNASRNALQQQVTKLNQSKTGTLCHLGWKMFNNKCYYASEKGVTKNWNNSRKDCQQRRADLVIITTKDELDFVTKIYDRTWIGLSDIQREGKWKWVDGSDLEGNGFWQTGEPNNSGDENCVEISRRNGDWNDAQCKVEIPWICEA